MFNGICHFGNFGATGALGAWGWASLIFHLVFWAALIAGVILLVVWLARQTRATQRHVQVNTQEILRERYARGEISRDEYRQMLEDVS